MRALAILVLFACISVHAQRYPRIAADTNAMLSMPVPDSSTVTILKGYASSNENVFLPFQYIRTSVATPNGSNVFQPTFVPFSGPTGVGRYHLMTISGVGGGGGIGTVTGGGTNGYLARWTATANDLTNGIIYDSGTAIGIGTTTPSQLLTVNGGIGTDDLDFSGILTSSGAAPLAIVAPLGGFITNAGDASAFTNQLPVHFSSNVVFHSTITDPANNAGAFGQQLIANGTDTRYYNPLKFVNIIDHCMGLTPQTAVPSGPFQFSNGGTGGTTVTGTGTDNNFGRWLMQATTTGQRASFGSGSAGALATMRFGGGRIRLVMAVDVPILSDDTDTFCLSFGFGDTFAATGDQVDGAYFHYSSTNLYYTNVAKWSGKTASNSVRTEVPSATTVVAATFYVLAIDVNAAGTLATFYVGTSYDTLASIGSTSLTIPVSVGREFGIFYKLEKPGAGSSTRQVGVNLTWLVSELTTGL